MHLHRHTNQRHACRLKPIRRRTRHQGSHKVEEAPAKTAALRLAAAPRPRRNVGTPRILIVDDQRSERFLLCEILQGAAPGVRLTAIGDPAEAIEYCRTTQVDLVLTDYRMPAMDGIELIRRLRSLPQMDQVPIVCVTVVDDRLVRYKAFEAGATDFLQRPLDAVECAARCRNLLALRLHQLQHLQLRVEEHTSRLRHEIDQQKLAQSAMRHFSLRLQTMTRRFVSAVDSDKRRLARELHDRVSSSLMAIGLHIGLIKQALPADSSPETLERLSDAADLVRQTMLSSREISADLHPATLEYDGVYAALDDYVKNFAQRNGIRISLTCNDPSLRLLPEKETALFRIAQEALLNSVKHAHANTIAIHLRVHGEHMVMTIFDDGSGFDANEVDKAPANTGVGLLSMRERAAAIGGTLSIDARPGKGTLIILAM